MQAPNAPWSWQCVPDGDFLDVRHVKRVPDCRVLRTVFFDHCSGGAIEAISVSVKQSGDLIAQDDSGW